MSESEFINLSPYGPAYSASSLDWEKPGKTYKLRLSTIVSGLFYLAGAGVAVYQIGLLVFLWRAMVLPYPDVPIGSAVLRSIEISVVPAAITAVLATVGYAVRRRFTAH